MASNRKRKRVRAVNNHEFETFIRTHLADDLANVIILTIGIRSYTGFLEFHDFNNVLLDVYDSMNEKDKLNLFRYHDASSSSSSTHQVKPAILRELKIFQDACRKQINNDNNEFISENSSSTQNENDTKKLKKSNTSQSIIFRSRSNDMEENTKIKYREKPINKNNEATDWSFDNEEASDYDLKSHDSSIPQDLIVKEATHIYVTTQKIDHFFEKNMQIKPQEQTHQIWHIYLPDFELDQINAYRVDSSFNPQNSDRFNVSKLVSNPYAPANNTDSILNTEDSAPYISKCVVIH
ncbi:unnamed protein product [Rotaria sp. Silwood1]|nr:unnamed protein product [Rotaria sp. Silwood1]